MKVLFVCTGNTCRSPMAEALLKNKSPKTLVQSAGIFAGKNQRANHHTIDALEQQGIPIDHLTQPVTEELLYWADIVITMTTQHKQMLIMEYPDLQNKYYTLKEYVSTSDKQVWKDLKKAYADLEIKRSQFVQRYRHQMDNNVLEHKLEKHLQDDIENIRQLEAGVINYDISDPFGGDFSTYMETLQELDGYVDLLVDKINQDPNHHS